ncbi:unnamed protein product [Meloidogyne enterolobii]|uniref:Uncharacterized protein n=1 Tax=Meloidogyne enterolobii TaxID=390850 RepID=A0ACB0Z246_MELEN
MFHKYFLKFNCVVYVSFGTINIEGMNQDNLKIMLNNFTNYEHCFFKVRLGADHYLQEHYLVTNISFEGFVDDQQEILGNYIIFNADFNLFYVSAKVNTKLFISHCGINSLTEVT